MSEQRRGEKEEEKKREKEEKEEEKRRDWGEKWRRDRVNAVVWASVAIWGALVLLAESTDFAADNFADWWAAWSVFLAGFGAIVLLGALFRSLSPEHRRPITGSLILGFILLGVGLGDLLDSWNIVWIVILLAIALTILFNAFIRRK